MLLKDRVAVITGSTGGMGLSIARAFAVEGAQVVLNGREMPRDLRASLARNMEKLGVRSLAVRGDVALRAAASRLIETALEGWGRIDILVNAAGADPMAAMEEIHEREWDRILRVNLKGAYLCAQAAWPHMKVQRWGVILNISSWAGRSGGGGPHVAASRGAMNSFTKSLAFEGASFGVRANAIAPGPVETGMQPFPEERRRFLRSVIPLGRLGTVEDIAGAAVFLCSDLAGFITGEILEVDGGLPLGRPV